MKALLLLPLLILPVFADHGPGTSGGGLSVQSGEIQKPGSWALGYRGDFTSFKALSNADLTRFAGTQGEIDLLDQSFVHTLALSYGISDGCSISLATGYYQATKGRSVALDPDTGELTMATNDPNGVTDLWFSAKVSIYKGPAGRFALFVGAKAPTGRYRVSNDVGERLDPSATAGTGAWDGTLGIAYSTYLTERFTLDASLQHIYRGHHDDFKVGDFTQAGVALAYRLNGDIHDFPTASVFAEILGRRIGKSEAGGLANPNTGGTAMFAGAGFRTFFTPACSATLAAQMPVSQSPNGGQIETRLKVSLGLSYTF
jgi:Putative MetA-pathway of phenol degradation